jgi:hypothetical protein
VFLSDVLRVVSVLWNRILAGSVVRLTQTDHSTGSGGDSTAKNETMRRREVDK